MHVGIRSLLSIIASLHLTGCVIFDAEFSTGTYGSGTIAGYSANPDGNSAALGALAVVPGLYLAYASRHTGAPGGFGAGLARFNGVSLEAFSMDGDLSATITPSSQPGFFLRPTTSYQGGTTLGSGYILVSDATKGFHDGVIAWGIWLDTVATLVVRGNQVLLGESADRLGGFHYVTGMPTLVPPQSGIARYQVIGEARSFAPGKFIETNSASLSVAWGNPVSKIGLDISLRNSYAGPETLYQMRTTGGAEDPASSQLNLSTGALAFSGALNMAVCPSGSTCSASVHGFFAGPNAERAGLAYDILDQAPGRPDEGVSGVYAFSFQDFLVPPTPPAPPGPITLLDQTNPNAFAMTFAASGVFGPVTAGPPATATQAADGQLTAFNFPSSPGNTVNVGRGTTQSPAAETGSDSLISWGRWTNGTTTGTGPGFGALTLGPNQGFHYAVGNATPPLNLPPSGSGTASFTLLGATKPTFGDGALAPGTFTGSMSVQWGGAAATKVGVDFTVAMPGDASYRMVSNGGLATPGTSLISTSLATGSSFSGPANVTVTGTGRACPLPCSANIGGFFAGPSAERAGVGYTIGLAPGTTIQGAAAFTR